MLNCKNSVGSILTASFIIKFLSLDMARKTRRNLKNARNMDKSEKTEGQEGQAGDQEQPAWVYESQAHLD